MVLIGIVPSAVADPAPASRTEWTPTASQVGEVSQRLLALASSSGDDAQPETRSTGDWPSNVTSVRVFGTDRPTALAAMGYSGRAVPDDIRLVVCAEATGAFSTADTPHPPGAPAATYRYAVTCMDADTGQVLDFGLDDSPASFQSSVSQQIDLSKPVG